VNVKETLTVAERIGYGHVTCCDVFNGLWDEDILFECDIKLLCERIQMLLFEAVIILLLWHHPAILTHIFEPLLCLWYMIQWCGFLFIKY